MIYLDLTEMPNIIVILWAPAQPTIQKTLSNEKCVPHEPSIKFHPASFWLKTRTPNERSAFLKPRSNIIWMNEWMENWMRNNNCSLGHIIKPTPHTYINVLFTAMKKLYVSLRIHTLWWCFSHAMPRLLHHNRWERIEQKVPQAHLIEITWLEP